MHVITMAVSSTVLLVLFLFSGAKGDLFFHTLRAGGRAFGVLLILVFGFLPLFSFFGLWDAYPSWALYSGTTSRGTLVLSEHAKELLPESVRHIAKQENSAYTLSLDTWAFKEMNVPAYPEERVFKNVARSVCAQSKAQSDMKLVIQERVTHGNKTVEKTLSCNDLPDQDARW